jgi:primosomal protein N' (replication factor Y) (superfamily II helicase)
VARPWPPLAWLAMAIAKVEPLLSTRNVRGPFDYRLPESMGDVEVGTILVVPFGRQRIKAVVVEVAETSDLPSERLAEPIEALEAGVPRELVELGRWVGEEYCSTPSRGLGLVLPPGTGTGAEARRVRPLLELEVERTEEGEAALADGERLGLRQKAALRALAGGARPARALANEAGADRSTIRRLEQRGFVATREVERRRRPASTAVGHVAGRVELNGAQRRAVAEITHSLGHGGEWLLHGVTGSGKTEVYLAAAGEALERGMGSIVLVPEIALTPQTVERFRGRFGERVALLHSRMPAGARYDEWRRLRSGEARIAVGPRSAVFAPVADLGLIVIDEEHDSSYKQESDPRYDAREVAAHRAAEAGAVLVAGSATPRAESWERMPRIELPERVDGIRMPPVEVLDMRDGVRGPLHPRTVEALAELRREGGKGILLINRRGWSSHLACRSCGRAWQCPECDVSLVLHRSGALRCHHCGHAEPSPRSCPDCASVTIARIGAGTQQVESELASLLDPLEVFRLDSDSAGGGHAELLSRFERADSGVLVGTQMVAKGHDFPEVTLGIVLDADGSLRMPDFRSEERTFALITQLAGRSGRGAAGGRVLVQALATGAPSVRRAAAHDAPGFLADELGRRRELRYPPYSHLIEIGLASSDTERLERAAADLRDLVSERIGDDVELLGPATLFRLRGKHRRRLILKAGERREAVSAVRDAVAAAVKGRRLAEVAVSVDVDPQ